MLKKILTIAEKEKVIKSYNSDIKIIFDDFLDEDEKKELSYELWYDDFEGKEWYFYVENNEIIGIIAFRNKTDKIVYISEFHILSNFQRKWFGSKMLAELTDFLKSQWVEIIYLETYYKYIHAKNFYIKNNFIFVSLENLKNSPLRDLYDFLVDKSLMFYKKI